MYSKIAAAVILMVILVSNLSASGRSRVSEGIYTSSQAARGQLTFMRHCARCHGNELAGGESAPELAGDRFLQRWQGHDLGELFNRITRTMPPQNPHSLDAHVYIDVVSFILQANGFPDGKLELAPLPTELKGITIE